MLKIEAKLSKVEGTTLGVLTLEGAVDSMGSLDLADAIDAAYAQNVYDIVVDMSRVSHVNSQGWGVFVSRLSLMGENRGLFRFAGMRPEVENLFEILGLGFIDGIHIYETVQEALATLRRPVLRRTYQQQQFFLLQRANEELKRTLAHKERAEKWLAFLTDQLDERLAERTASSEAQARRLQETNAQLEEQNQRLRQANNVARQFVSNVSHEFRTPLTVIKECVGALQDILNERDDAEAHELPEIILQRVNDLSVMINDLLDISRLEANILRMSRRICRIEDIVQRVKPTLERKGVSNNVAFEIGLDKNLPSVYCDPEKIGRVIVNLAVNALKFVEESGYVRLWARHEPSTSEVHVGVTDDGPGISAEQQELLFRRFSQLGHRTPSSTKGFGLGLSIAKELVNLNLGDIRVHSLDGMGTVFYFTLPVADPSTIMAHYLRWIERMPNGKLWPEVSILSVEVDDSDPLRLADVEGLLENQMRRNDLLFRQRLDSWLLVAAAGSDGAALLIERLRAAHRQANQARPHRRLLPMRFRVDGTWRVADQNDQLSSCLEAALPAQAWSRVGETSTRASADPSVPYR